MPLLSPFAELQTVQKFYNKINIPVAQFKALNSAPLNFIPSMPGKVSIWSLYPATPIWF